MPRTLTEEPVHRFNWEAILDLCSNACLWLATWAERNVEPGEDGQHIPPSVRSILVNRNYYI